MMLISYSIYPPSPLSLYPPYYLFFLPIPICRACVSCMLCSGIYISCVCTLHTPLPQPEPASILCSSCLLSCQLNRWGKVKRCGLGLCVLPWAVLSPSLARPVRSEDAEPYSAATFFYAAGYNLQCTATPNPICNHARKFIALWNPCTGQQKPPPLFR